MKTFVKDPDAKLDYSVDWNKFLTAVNDTIATAVWVNDDVAITVEDAGDLNGFHTAFVSGGVLDANYTITSRITTTGGRINDSSFVILIKET